MPKNLPAIIIIATALFMGIPDIGLAHKVKIFATTEGGQITGFAYYPGGAKYINSPISVSGPDGRLLAEIQTNEQGAFTYKPTSNQTHVFTIATKDGHKAEFRVAANATSTGPASQQNRPAPLGANAPTKPGEPRPDNLEAIINKSVARQINPLREDIARYEQKVRLHDIIGGIGYIFGLFGLYIYLRNQKQSS